MNKISKAIIIAVIIMITVLSLAGCGGKSNTIAQPAPEEGAKTVEITGSCTVEKTGDRNIRVHGVSNLMNGTKMAVCIDTAYGENIETKKYYVDSEGFYADFTIPKNEEGPFYASIVVMPTGHGKQPLEVREAYGPQLQNLTGEHVIWNTEGNCVVILSESFEF